MDDIGFGIAYGHGTNVVTGSDSVADKGGVRKTHRKDTVSQTGAHGRGSDGSVVFTILVVRVLEIWKERM